MKKILLLLLSILPLGSCLHAQTTPSNTNAIVIDMVPNTKKSGETPAFYISRHAINPEQYCAFLNTVDTTEGRFYHSEWGDMMRKDWGLLTIAKSTTTPIHYTLINYPTYRITTELNPSTGLYHAVTNAVPERTIMKGVPMADAARFCNWLANGQPSGSIGDETTETGSYTFFENRERQPSDSWILKTIYDPKFLGGIRLKNAYMSVTKTAGSTWRLPTRTELSIIFSPLSWGALDSDSALWYWTEDAYINDFPASMRDPYHTGFTQNTGGYYRVKNGQANSMADLQTHKFQEELVVDTGFCVVFSANALPQNGFRILLPSEVLPETTSSNSLPPVLPPVLPLPPVSLPPQQEKP